MRARTLFVLGLFATLIWIVWSDVRGARWHPLSRRQVDTMLDLAEVGPDDLIYDLGAGDGRIVIEAARRGARAVGIEIDPIRVSWARRSAERAGVADRVSIVRGDLFGLDLSDADVVTCFLTQATNDTLEPKLARELDPDARVLSAYHTFPTLNLVGADKEARVRMYSVGS
jgi:SAM-dependent methyltransferase